MATSFYFDFLFPINIFLSSGQSLLLPLRGMNKNHFLSFGDWAVFRYLAPLPVNFSST